MNNAIEFTMSERAWLIHKIRAATSGLESARAALEANYIAYDAPAVVFIERAVKILSEPVQ